ncbi:MAG: DNA topoisomerase I [Candidatus Jordarchaeum sp.]|uniref:DNA topoisomerase I n=1 Tax=Candidatus Jordarchaeum sp. TaxID=2823881 RepID=UPI00404AA560
MKQLIHNGILFPQYEAKEFSISYKGKKIKLEPEQEEMAVAWVKKRDTDYVNDPVFVKNFFNDFGKALGLGNVSPEDFDFSEIIKYVDEEKLRKANLSKEEKKKLAAERKEIREKNKEKYGHAIIDGKRVEIGNYNAEPSSIFMGRGKHPLRGKWKKGPKPEDVILNLSPDAPRPPGNWKEIVWEPDYMWIAKWEDKLRGKLKHVWVSDTSHLKQEREIEKFNKARKLENKIEDLRKHIEENLTSKDLKRRKIATVCYLIDVLKLRVGDEKDKDEADTVGATTLRPSHIKIGENGLTKFNFLGKDSVKWEKEVYLPPNVIKNLEEFMSQAKSAIFAGVRSSNVSQFLEEIMPGLTAKVFRTYHATKVVKQYLNKSEVIKNDPEYVKKNTAKLANLEAAIVSNHKKQVSKSYKSSLEKKIERLKKLKQKKGEKAQEKVKEVQTQIELMKKTKNYNLTTSLKSYIDPRVYYNWFQKVDYDWKKYYPKTLQRKFSWVEEEAE